MDQSQVTQYSPQQQAIARARAAFDQLRNGNVLFQQCINQQHALTALMAALKTRNDRKSNKLFEKFQRYTSVLQNFSEAIDVVVQTQAGIGCPLWAPIRFILQVSNYRSEIMNHTLRMIETVYERRDIINIYENMKDRPPVQSALINMFADIVDFALRILQYLQKNVFARLSKIILTPLKKDLDDITQRLRAHIDLAQEAAGATEMQEAEGFRRKADGHAAAVTADMQVATAFRSSQSENDELDTLRKWEKWLAPSDMGNVLHSRSSEKLSGTCDWIWSHPEMQTWNSSPTSAPPEARLLCISGIHGCGKSVLSASIHDTLRQSGAEGLYFSFFGTDSTRQSFDHLARSLLWQSSRRPLPANGLTVIKERMSRGRPLASELWDMLSQFMSNWSKPIYIIIDGVDECSESAKGLLGRTMSLMQQHPSIRTILLGRPQVIDLISEKNRRIKISSDLTSSDIDIFIGDKLSKSSLFQSADLHDIALEELRAGSQGMFLWVKLMAQDLCDRSTSRAKVLERLQHLPRGLYKAYRRILQQLVRKSDDMEIRSAQRILSLVIAARRPLKLEELRYAEGLAHRFDRNASESHSLEDYLSQAIAHKIAAVCDSLLHIDADTVYLGHQSAMEFLTRPLDQWNCEQDREIKDLRVALEQSHHLFSFACIDYLGIREYDFLLENVEDTSDPWDVNPLLEYAAANFIYHYNRSENIFQDVHEKMFRFWGTAAALSWLQYYIMYNLAEDDTSSYLGELWPFSCGLVKIGHTAELQALLRSCKRNIEHQVRILGEDDPMTDDYKIVTEAISWLEEVVQDADENDSSGPITRVSNAQASTARMERNNLEDQRSMGECPSTTLRRHLYVRDNHPMSRLRIQMLELFAQNRSLAIGTQTRLGLTILKKSKALLMDPLNALFQTFIRSFKSIPAYALLVIGEFYESVNQDDKAIQVYTCILEEIGTSERLTKCLASSIIGNIHERHGRLHEAENAHETATKSSRVIFGPNNGITVECSVDWGRVLRMQEKYSEAETVYRRAMEACQISRAGDEVTVTCLHGLALSYQGLGEYALAERTYVQVLESFDESSNSSYLDILYDAMALGRLLNDTERYSEAEEILRKTGKAMKKILGPDHEASLYCTGLRACSLFGQEKYDEAEDVYRELVDRQQRILGADHIFTLNNTCNLAATFVRQNKYSDAKSILYGLMEIEQRVFGASWPATITWMSELAEVLLGGAAERPEIETICREVVEAICALPTEIHAQCELFKVQDEQQQLERVTDMLHAAHNLGMDLAEKGWFVQAEEVLRSVAECCRKVLGSDHEDTLLCGYNLRCTLYDQGKCLEAEHIFRKLLDIEVFRRLGYAAANASNMLGTILRDQGRHDEADQLCFEEQQSLAVIEDIEDIEDIEELSQRLAALKNTTIFEFDHFAGPFARPYSTTPSSQAPVRRRSFDFSIIRPIITVRTVRHVASMEF